MSERFDLSDPAQYAAGIEAAKEAISKGELIVLPTDTVYGVGADAFTPWAVARLLAAKGRGRDMPPPVLVGTVRAATALVDDFGPFGQDLIDEFWPGGLTLVARSTPTLAWDLGETRGTVAVRMPLHAAALDLLKKTGPMAVSSANIDRQPGRDDRRRSRRTARRLHRGLPGRRPLRRGRRVHDHRPDRLGAPPAPRRRDRHGPPPRGRDPGHRRGNHPARRRHRP